MKPFLRSSIAVAVLASTNAATAQTVPAPSPGAAEPVESDEARTSSPSADSPAARARIIPPRPSVDATKSRWNAPVTAIVDPDYAPRNPREVPLLSATRGFAAAVQVGYAIPAGTTSGENDQASTFAGQYAMVGEIGVRITSEVFIGAYAGYAIGDTGSRLERPCLRRDCSASSARAGVAIRYRFFPALHVEPWVGYAAGYETANITLADHTQSRSISYTGWEYAHLSLGLDYSDDALYAVGPVIDVGIGQYDHVDAEGSSGSAGADVSQKALHEWITIGVRWTIMP